MLAIQVRAQKTKKLVKAQMLMEMQTIEAMQTKCQTEMRNILLETKE